MEPEDDYGEFLQELVDHGHLSDVAAGITRQVIAQGETSLSPKQQAVYDREVKEPFLNAECERCGGDIPASELSGALDNDGLCGWCAQVGSRED